MKNILLLSTLVLTSTTLHAQTPSLDELWEIVKAQEELIQNLQSELSANENKIEETHIVATSVAEAVESTFSASETNQQAESWANRTSIGGYGEHHYNIVEDGSDQIDAHRYVLYINHHYSDTIQFFSEFELEHSLAGDGKPGEVELEQAFINWQFAENHNASIGQFLLPVGILNEMHEPDTFYGVERNNVEKEVIPSTWWESGVMLSGELAPGLAYDAAIHSGLMVENFRIRWGRQKSAEAVADDLAFTGRIRYTAMPGLELSASVQYQSDIAQGTLTDSASATLFETHAVYQGEVFGLRALYAAWDIYNAEFEQNGSDDLEGWYIEPSVRLSQSTGLFARYSNIDPRRGDKPSQETEQFDIGVNYWLNPNVVLKADYQNNLEAGDDAFNLGVGWSF